MKYFLYNINPSPEWAPKVYSTVELLTFNFLLKYELITET